MIENFYKDFKIRDYMDENTLKDLSLNNVIDCSLGTNAFIDEQIIKNYIFKSNYELNKYPIKEYELLKNEILKFWRNHTDCKLHLNNISFGSGVMGILRNLCEFLMSEKTRVLGIAPEFPRFISEVELKKATYEYYSLDINNNYKFITDDFLDKMEKQYDVIHLENPNNPTGQIIDINDIEKIVKKAEKQDSIVIVDEAYGEYMKYSNSAITLVEKYDNLVVLRSASKFYGLPNHRVGYLFASQEFIKIYNEIALPFPFSDLSANVFRNILENYKKIENSKQTIIEINQKIYQVLNSDSFLFTNVETPIFTVKSNKYKNLSNELSKKGIIAENCATYLNLDSNFARIRIPKEWKKLLEVLEDTL